MTKRFNLAGQMPLLSCPGRAQRDPGPRSDTTSRSHVLRLALFLRWVPALVPLAQARSLHSAGTREQCTLLIRFSMRGEDETHIPIYPRHPEVAALRAALEGRPSVTLAGRVPHEEVRRWIQAADVVCQPSLVEPFGQALLEAMASERSVLATVVGGPPEFVIPAAGVLVDPQDVAAIADGLRRAAELPSPNRAARSAAAAHDVNFQAARIEEILEQAARGRRA